MDKRFLLALVLTAIVVVVTPWLFGTSRQQPGARASSSNPQPDSAHRAESKLAVSREPNVPVVVDSSIAVPADTAKVQAARPETTSVSTPVARYELTSIGAAPVLVTLSAYRALDGSDGHVRLGSGSGPLLGYRLFTRGDTVDLSRLPFAATRTTAADGRPVLSYQATVADVNVLIRYSFVPDSYLVRVSGEVTPAPAGEDVFLGVSLPATLQSAEADSLDDQRHLAYAIKPQRENARGISFGKLDPGERRLEAGPITWAAAKNKYFIVGLLAPVGGVPFAEVSVTGGPRTGRQATRASASVLAPVRNGTFGFELYTGPQEWRRLLALGRDFENSNPYGGFLQGVVQPFATIVMRILLWMRATLNLSYGWVLVIFGLVVRLLLWPLNQKAMRTSMKMSRLQPELSEIQKRHKADPQRMQAEIMRVYREHGMSPFSSLSGCLPMLLPMPVLFALFFVFQNTIEFRGVPFLWLADISLKDPYYIVPILMGVSMYVLSIIGMRNSPPNPQAKMMAYVLPVMMTVFFLNLASGLNLYYAVQNLAAIPQQWMIANERGKATANTLRRA